MAEILLQEGIAPNAPASGNLALYAKQDRNLYTQNDQGVEVPLTGGAGGGLKESDLFSDFIVSGVIGTVPGVPSLTMVLPAGIAYAIGARVQPVAYSYAYPISSDCYVDLSNVGNYQVVAVANGGAAPAVTAQSLRTQKVVTSATAITGVTALADLYAVVTALGVPNAVSPNQPVALKQLSNGTEAIAFTTGTFSGQVHGAVVVTLNTTIGAATLSGASMVGGVITRSGSIAAYTDTTDTATDIIAAIPFAAVGTSFNLRITNTVAFVDTIAAGVGVTLAGTTAIAASTFRDFVGVITSTNAPAVTLTGTGSGSL